VDRTNDYLIDLVQPWTAKRTQIKMFAPSPYWNVLFDRNCLSGFNTEWHYAPILKFTTNLIFGVVNIRDFILVVLVWPPVSWSSCRVSYSSLCCCWTYSDNRGIYEYNTVASVGWISLSFLKVCKGLKQFVQNFAERMLQNDCKSIWRYRCNGQTLNVVPKSDWEHYNLKRDCHRLLPHSPNCNLKS